METILDTPALRAYPRVIPALQTMTIRQRFGAFTDSIRPDDSTIEEARRQVAYLEQRLHDLVSEDETFTLVKVLRAGSNAKHTSLLRTSENEWDVDLGAYFTGEGATKADFDELLAFVEAQIRRIYPNKDKGDITAERSAVRLVFRSGIKLCVDVAPIIADEALHVENGGWIPRKDGYRLTSVTAHNAFVRTRSASSATAGGPVAFNKLVRLVKWWNNRLPAEICMPSIFCDHVTAAAVEQMGGVTDQWQTSVRGVFRFIAQVNRLASPIIFSDYYDPDDVSVPRDLVVVMDVVNPENNVALKLDTAAKRDAYVAAAQAAYDDASYARSLELDAEIDAAVDVWCDVFGPAFRELSEATQPA